MSARRLWYTFLDLWTAVPWVFLLWLGEVIASHRWSGVPLLASLAVSAAAAYYGWQLVCRWGERQHDLEGARLLQAIPDPEPWERFIHPAQTIKAAHLSHCQRSWGVNARSSGWGLLQRRGWRDLAAVPACMFLAVHPWWLVL